MEENYINHTFKPNETVMAILRKYNKYTSDNEVLTNLMKLFHDLNGMHVYKPGMKVKIPILIS